MQPQVKGGEGGGGDGEGGGGDGRGGEGEGGGGDGRGGEGGGGGGDGRGGGGGDGCSHGVEDQMKYWSRPQPLEQQVWATSSAWVHRRLPRDVHSVLAFAQVVIRLKLVCWGVRPLKGFVHAAQIELWHVFAAVSQQRTPAV